MKKFISIAVALLVLVIGWLYNQYWLANLALLMPKADIAAVCIMHSYDPRVEAASILLADDSKQVMQIQYATKPPSQYYLTSSQARSMEEKLKARHIPCEDPTTATPSPTNTL